jgi:hypothetical protein
MKRFLTVLHTIGLIIACLSVPFAIFIVLRFSPSPVRVPEVTYADLTSTLLVGLTIVLGVVALMIAGLAIWGYHAIRDEGGRIATDEAKRASMQYLAGGEAQERLRSDANKIILAELAKIRESADLASAFQSTPIGGTIPIGEDKGNVGKPYPQKNKGNDHEA